MPAEGCSGETETRTPADSRQPLLPGLSPVATPEIKPAGAGKWLRDLDTHSGETETYRRCVAGELQVPFAAPLLYRRWRRLSRHSPPPLLSAPSDFVPNSRRNFLCVAMMSDRGVFELLVMLLGGDGEERGTGPPSSDSVRLNPKFTFQPLKN